MAVNEKKPYYSAKSAQAGVKVTSIGCVEGLPDYAVNLVIKSKTTHFGSLADISCSATNIGGFVGCEDGEAQLRLEIDRPTDSWLTNHPGDIKGIAKYGSQAVT